MDKREMDDARWERLRRRRRWTAVDAVWAVDRWRASGEPLTKFADDHQLHRERLRRWRSRLGEIPGGKGPAVATASRATALVPVSIRSAPLVVGDGSAVVVSAGQVQIAVRDLGVTSPDWVARLVGRLAAEGVS